MKVLTEADLPLDKENVCTIGNFDGFHKGHSYILKNVQQTAEATGKSSLAITFEPHPKKILDPENAPCRITDKETKITLFEEQNIDYIYIIHFNKAFAQKSPEEFLDFLVNKLKCCRLIVGHDWRFGYQGKGNALTAVKIGKKIGLEVDIISPLYLKNERISSTIIRKLLKEGKVDEMYPYLGREYFISGKTVKGNRLGSRIGFPTMNVLPVDDLCLRKGVYSGYVQYLDELFPSVINYGNRPTVDGTKNLIEAHIIGKDINIPPGSKIKIFFSKFLREEEKFSNIDQLKKQIQMDVNSAMKLLEVKK